MVYDAVICARNEEDHLETCLDSLFNQFCLPDNTVLVDDGSTDHTPIIAQRYPLEYIRINPKRVETRGVNTSYALKVGLNHTKSFNILTLDADIQLPPDYTDTLLHKMNLETGLISGFSFDEPYRSRDVPNGARLYRREILEYIPLIPGFDTYLKYKVKQLGYNVKGVDIRFRELRPRSGINGLKRHYYWGLATRIVGQPLPIACVKTLRYLKHRPQGLCSMVFLLSYLLHRGWRVDDSDYYSFTDLYYRQLIGRGVVKMLGGLHPWS